ncbi:MAG TPA: hypothetical protein QGF58_18925 [Myxococcota bacterium]|nr:hypothetical protein [Myxococcota bacterium]
MSDQQDPALEEEEEETNLVSHEDYILRAERSVGTSKAGKAANGAVLALARAARSFLLYDARNAAIRAFLDDFQKRMDHFFAHHGEMSLQIRPFEMVLEGGEVIYVERDRTRSLAFRLFRDGVRNLVIEATVNWDELLRLLEILSIRYTGIRSQEDDIVTLLWKAAFQNIRIQAVEGVMLDEEEERVAEGGYGGYGGAYAGDGDAEAQDGEYTGPARRISAQFDAPRDRDRPLPRLGESRELRYAPLTRGQVDMLRAELDTQDLAFASLTLVERLLHLVNDPVDPMVFEDVRHFVIELRVFLMAEEQLGSLVTLIDLVASVEDADPDAIRPILAGFVDAHAIRRILKSIQHTHSQPPDELLHLLDLVEGNHLDTFIELVEVERGAAPRRIARQLVERYIPGNEDYAIQRMLAASDPGVMRDLLRACAHAVPERTLEAAEALAATGEPDVLRELLYFLQHIPSSHDASAALLNLLNCGVSEVRTAAIDELGQREHTQVRPLITHLTEHRPLPNEEAEALGLAIARLDPRLAQVRFREWIRPGGFFARFFAGSGDVTLQFAAAAGLELLDEEGDDALLEWLGKRAGDDLYRRCKASIVRRRQRRRGGAAAHV